MTGIRTAIRNWCSSRHITLIGESNQTSRASAKAREDKQAAEYVERLRRALTELGSAYQLLLEQIGDLLHAKRGYCCLEARAVGQAPPTTRKPTLVPGTYWGRSRGADRASGETRNRTEDTTIFSRASKATEKPADLQDVPE
jgi:hypothetical protein